MRIAQVAPFFESVPPKYYGGTGRAVFHLTEELVHEVPHTPATLIQHAAKQTRSPGFDLSAPLAANMVS
jgi:hypothetical protein